MQWHAEPMKKESAMTSAKDDPAVASPQSQPPKPYENDPANSQELVMAAYALCPAKPQPEMAPMQEQDHDAGAAAVVEQVMALRNRQSPVDPAEFKNRLVGVIRNLHPVR